MNEESWDARYRSRGALWSGEANPQLMREIAELAPGVALDAGCGEGADAIWLAERGWRVTAVDFSAVALQRGAARALEAGADVAQRIGWVHADLLQWAPVETAYDLVSVHFIQLPDELRAPMFGRLAAAVTNGGTLLVVGHHPSDLQTTVPRPPFPELFYTADDVAQVLDPKRWDIIVAEARERGATDPDGRAVAVHDSVLRAWRRT